jgi:hypothetical protein
MTAPRPIVHPLPLVGALVSALAGPVSAEEAGIPKIEAPDLQFDVLHGGTLLAPHGFVARIGERMVMGDALRYDRANDDLYATGRVVMVMPGVRIHAERLGMHPQAESGDAWNVEAFVERQGRRLVITAERAHFDRLNVVFDGVRANAGYGGIIGFGASSAHVYLREEPAEDRQGFRREVAGVSMTSPTARIIGIPVLWVPYVYRDFVYDYPWTRYVGGHSRRLGDFVTGWIGSDLPEVAGWHPRLEARGDAYSRTGEGYGAEARWERPGVGTGQVEWFNIPHEIVMGGEGDRENLATRSAHVLDAEQQLHATTGFGSGALYARWVSLPDPDPIDPANPTLAPPPERFRADYLRDDLDRRPLARRGVTGVWTVPFGSLTLDTERRPNIELQTTDRLWGAELSVPQTRLIGPLHLAGDAWTEDLRREAADTQALRTRYDTALSAMEWQGPFGFDADGGLRGLRYNQGRLAGVDFADAQGRWLPYADAGVRLRVEGDLDDGLLHTVTPRIGVQVLGTGRGDTLPAYGFGDTRDVLEEDKRYLVTSLDTALTRSRTLFYATVAARWALRDQDRLYLDSAGAQQLAANRLVDVIGNAQGSPIASVTLTTAFDYDAQRHAWQSINATAAWVAARNLQFRYTATLLPADTVPGEEHGQIWQQTPGITVLANRYRFDGDFTFQPGGHNLDQWELQATRRMVDGELTLFYQVVHNPDGSLYDQRIGVGFSTTLGTSPAATSTGQPSARPAHSTGINFR